MSYEIHNRILILLKFPFVLRILFIFGCFINTALYFLHTSIIIYVNDYNEYRIASMKPSRTLNMTWIENAKLILNLTSDDCCYIGIETLVGDLMAQLLIRTRVSFAPYWWRLYWPRLKLRHRHCIANSGTPCSNMIVLQEFVTNGLIRL